MNAGSHHFLQNMPPAKRQRISRACEPCRKRKSKCDGEQPSCLMCQSAERKCVYANSTKRRGLQSGYVRGLETMLGLIVRWCPETEVQIEKLLRRQETKDCLLGGHDGETCIQTWRSSPCFRKINSVIQQQPCDSEDESPLPEDNAVDFADLRRPHDSGKEATDTSISLQQSNAVSTPHTNSICEPTEEKSGTTALNTFDLFEQPFPSHTIELMEDYFTFTHSWFPILERQKLLRVMHGQPGSVTHDRQVIDTGHRMSLWALIAYTLAARPLSYQRHAILNPQNLEMSIRARALVDDDNFSLGHVQAILILVLLRLKLGHTHAAWILVAQAVRMIDVLRHRPQLGRYKQVFQGCVILDNFISTLLDRSPCLSGEEIGTHGAMNVDDEEDEESLDEWDIWTLPSHIAAHCKEGIPSRSPLRALSTFKLMFELMCYFSKVSSHRSREQEIINSDLQQLQDWRLNLPAHCQWTDSPDSLKPPVLVLHLSINFVISTLLTRRCNMALAPNASCTEIAKLSTELLQKYIHVTGKSWVPPLFLGFATQARKLMDLSISASSNQASIKVREALRKITDDTSCSSELDDRGVYWKGLRLPNSAVTSHTHTDKPSTYHTETLEESEIYLDIMGSTDIVDNTGMTGEVPFEALCEQIVASYPLERYV